MMEEKKVSDYRPDGWLRYMRELLEIIQAEIKDGDNKRIQEALEQSLEAVFSAGIMSILQAIAESKMEWKWDVGDDFNGCLKLIFPEIPYAFTFDFGNIMAFDDVVFQGAKVLGYVKARKEDEKKKKDNEIASLNQMMLAGGGTEDKGDWQKKLDEIARRSKEQTEKDREENKEIEDETDKRS